MKNSNSAKLVLIGGGSYGWTYKFITDIACLPELHGMQIVLHDLNPEALALVSKLCRKISATLNADLKIETTTDLDAALPGADFVGLTISTAGEWGNGLDHSIPQKYGVTQTVGDTVGPGGWSRALRNIPIVVDIVRKVEKLAPNAWFMNYSNPMTTLTRVIQKVSNLKTVGLCHELQGLLLHTGYFLGVDWAKDIQVEMAGINHLIWVLKMDVKGQDGLELLKRYAFDKENFTPLGEQIVSEELMEGGGVCPGQEVKFDFLRRFGALPAAGDRHTIEFFSYFLKDEESIARWGFKESKSFAHLHGLEKRKQVLLDLLAGKRDLHLKHSFEHASRIIAALLGVGENIITPVNTANVGQIDNLPREVVVETQAIACASGIHPLSVGTLPNDITCCLMQHIPVQEMIVEAGLSGDKELAIHALSLDPLIQSPELAANIATDIFAQFKEHLPQFNDQWELA